MKELRLYHYPVAVKFFMTLKEVALLKKGWMNIIHLLGDDILSVGTRGANEGAGCVQ